MTINPDRYFRTLKTLDTFVDRALDLMPNTPKLSGFNYDVDLLFAAVANSYIETVGTHADSLHLAIKRVTASDIYSGECRKSRYLEVFQPYPRFHYGST